MFAHMYAAYEALSERYEGLHRGTQLPCMDADTSTSGYLGRGEEISRAVPPDRSHSPRDPRSAIGRNPLYTTQQRGRAEMPQGDAILKYL